MWQIADQKKKGCTDLSAKNYWSLAEPGKLLTDYIGAMLETIAASWHKGTINNITYQNIKKELIKLEQNVQTV